MLSSHQLRYWSVPVFVTMPASQAVLSSELLGYPADARLLIINADDFGMHPSLNSAALHSIENGIAGSCSLMPPCPGARQALHLLRERPHIRFGIHLTLVCDFSADRWKPLAPVEIVPSLLDGNGHLFTPTAKAQLLAQARRDEVELELRSQIETVLATGLTPTHLDWHALADGGREDIFDLGLALAEEYRLAARVWLDRGRRLARQQGLPVVDHDFLDSFSLDIETKASRYFQLLRDLPAGLSEWAVHPGLGDAASLKIDDGWEIRRTDLDFLTSPEARDAVRREGIVIIDYGAIRHAWSRR
jgi:chitin disaccharide deacetylase